ncbi:hypothetical protein [Spiroplasma endosymbiont of Amphibalanus improvisus]|uniref:hypothetical protein n=1 Tax=Spiroplasma endosymbiont of Amphibalanus improvisus TaxID=3066327 RepID=UPI00313ADBE9
MMNWYLYFIIDDNNGEYKLRSICKTPETAVEELKDNVLENKKTDESITSTSTCLVFKFDSGMDNYVFDKSETSDFIKKVPLCSQCNYVKTYLNDEDICNACTDELKGNELFKCNLCSKKWSTHDRFDRELFGTFRVKNKDYKICGKCAFDSFKPLATKEAN